MNPDLAVKSKENKRRRANRLSASISSFLELEQLQTTVSLEITALTLQKLQRWSLKLKLHLLKDFLKQVSRYYGKGSELVRHNRLKVQTVWFLIVLSRFIHHIRRDNTSGWSKHLHVDIYMLYSVWTKHKYITSFNLNTSKWGCLRSSFTKVYFLPARPHYSNISSSCYSGVRCRPFIYNKTIYMLVKPTSPLHLAA